MVKPNFEREHRMTKKDLKEKLDEIYNRIDEQEEEIRIAIRQLEEAKDSLAALGDTIEDEGIDVEVSES